MVVLDVALIFQTFNGPRGLVDALCKHQPGIGLTYNTVQMWWQRRQIPSKYVGAVLFCCAKKRVSLDALLVDEDAAATAAGAAALGL